MAKEHEGHWSGTNSAGRPSEIFDLGDGRRGFLSQRADSTWSIHESPAEDDAPEEASEDE